MNQFRQRIAGLIDENPAWNQAEIAGSYQKVKNVLEECFSKEGKEYLRMNEFYHIARQHGIEENNKQKSLLKALHSLGISLNYDTPDMKGFNTLVLNPEWISHGVYTVINSANDRRTEDRYRISLSDFEKFFSKESKRYPVELHEFIYRLMLNYELAYCQEQKDDPEDLIVPILLDEDQPEELPDFPIGNNVLMARYALTPGLPLDVISRFIVRLHKDISDIGHVWRYGVILTNGKNTALVRADDTERTIAISVKGPGKTEYVARLRSVMESLLEKYKQVNFEKSIEYRIDMFGKIPTGDGENQHEVWSKGKELEGWIKRGRLTYYSGETEQEFSVGEIIKNYGIPFEFPEIPDKKYAEFDQTINKLILIIIEQKIKKNQDLEEEIERIKRELTKPSPSQEPVKSSSSKIWKLLGQFGKDAAIAAIITALGRLVKG